MKRWLNRKATLMRATRWALSWFEQYGFDEGDFGLPIH